MKGGVRLVSILFVFSSTLLFAQENFQLSHEPGFYNEDILLEVTSSQEHEDILYRFKGEIESQILSYNEALALRAFNGAQSSYEIEFMMVQDGRIIASDTLNYTIDKLAPPVPRVDRIPGIYTGPLKIQPLSASASGFQYRLRSSQGRESGELAAHETLELTGQSREFVPYQLEIHAVDEAGNLSSPAIFIYTIDRRSETIVDDIPVLSPVQGSFSNPQLLYIDKRGFDRLWYRIEGITDASAAEAPYQGPVLLPSGEGLILKVRGVTHDGRELEKSVQFSAGFEQYPGMLQGSLSEPLELLPSGAGQYYRVDDNPVSSFDSPFIRPLRLNPQEASLRALPLRILDTRSTASKEYRYFLLLDGRLPARPIVRVSSFSEYEDTFFTVEAGATVSRKILIEAEIEDGTQLFYSTDGTSPEQHFVSGTGVPRELFTREELLLPEAENQLTLIIQAVRNASLWGDPVTLDFPLEVNAEPAREASAETQVDASAPQFSLENNSLMIQSSTLRLYEFDPPLSSPILLGPGETAALSLPRGMQMELLVSSREISPGGSIGGLISYAPILIDTQLTQGPVISTEETEVRIDLEENLPVYYRIIAVGHEVPDTNPEFILYEGSFKLPRDEGRNYAFIVEAYGMTEAGPSPRVRSDLIAVHTRPPSEPRIAGFVDGFQTRETSLVLDLLDPEPGVRYHYKIFRDDDSRHPPGPEDPWTNDSIEISLSENRSTQDIETAIQPISEANPGLRGPLRSFTFTFDTQAPDAPVITGVADGERYSESVRLYIEAEDFADIEYQLSREDGEILAVPGTRYREEILVSGLDDRSLSYELKATAIDRAGNRSPIAALDFTIDRERPGLPELRLSDSTGILDASSAEPIYSQEALELAFSGTDLVLYEISTRSSLPRIPDGMSTRASEPIVLDTDPGTEQKFSILYRSIDAAGNLGELSEVLSVIIDRRPPAIPPEPEISREGNRGLISWESLPDVREFAIEYALLPAAAAPSDESFAIYEQTSPWEISGDQEMAVYYRAVDKAGNTSSVAMVPLPYLDIAPLPKILGVQDGGVYTTPLSVEVFPNGTGLVRYEISTDGSAPDQVLQTSPVWARALNFTPVDGETVEYRVRMRQFIPGYEPSEELLFHFTIDRTAPLPPEIRGISQSAYLLEPFTVDFITESDGQAVFSLSAVKIEPGELPSFMDGEVRAPADMGVSEFGPFEESFELTGSPGELHIYSIQAYSYDRAGNRSIQDRKFTIAIDRRNLFVDSLAEEGGNGSPGAPLRFLPDAVDLARQQGRTEIYLGSGNYALTGQLVLDGTLRISGSYSRRSWQQDPDSGSYLYPEKAYADDHLVRVRSGALRLDALYLADGSQDLESLIRADNAELIFRSLSLSASGGSSGITAVQSSLSLTSSSINGYELRESTLIALADSVFSASDSLIQAEDLPEFLDSGIHGNYILVHARNSELSFESTDIVSSSGDDTVALYLFNSRASMRRESNVFTGSGRNSASGVFMEDSLLSLENGRISGDSRAALVTLINSRNSRLELKNSVLELAADFGASGILASGGEILISDSTFSSTGADDFVHPISVRGGAMLSVQETDFNGARTAEYVLASIEDSHAEFSGSRLRFSGEEEFGIAFLLGEDARAELAGNILSGSFRGTAIRLQSALEDIDLSVEQNSFENWGLLLEEYRESPRSSVQQAGRYQTLQQLENIDSQNLIFRNNSINQGL